MRILIRSALCLALIAGISACDRRADPENQPTPDPTTTTTPSAVTPADSSTPPADAAMNAPAANDALVLGLLGAVNEHEIAAAQQAEGKNVSAPVLTYATMMETEHSENQSKTVSLGTLANTDEVQAKNSKGEQELAELDTKAGAEYEAAYVDAMVKGHTEVLSLIDTKLIPLASSEAVKQHMQDTRDDVAMHLAKAQELQTSMSSK